MPAYRSLALLLFASLSACEIPRAQPIAPGALPTLPEEVAVDVPISNDRDGRIPPPSFDSGTPLSLVSVANYDPGQPPAPLRTKVARVQVHGIGAPLSTPSKVRGTTVQRVVLTPESLQWEPALLEAGITVLDRVSLQGLELEHFLQKASIPISAAKQGTTTAGAMPMPSFGVPIAARSPRPDGRPLVWQHNATDYSPYLNGSKTPGEDRLQSGEILSSKWLLDLTPPRTGSDSLALKFSQPTAAQIPYTARSSGTGSTPAFDSFNWKADPEDPFHFTAEGDSTFFDPQAGSLWQLRHAWFGTEVSREEFNRGRFEVTIKTCTHCLDSTSSTRAIRPAAAFSAAGIPCPVCGKPIAPKYYAGYFSDELPADSNQAILQGEWLPWTPGVYPTLQMGSSPAGIQTRKIMLQSDTPSSSQFLRNASPEGLVDTETVDWCVVDFNGRGTLFSQESLAAFNDIERITKGQSFEIPACGKDGKQLYALARKPYQEKEFNLPVEVASIDVRLVSTEQSTVSVAGTLSLSYLNLPEASRILTATSAGLDLSEWPTGTVQQGKLLVALRQRLAQLLRE